MPRAGAVSPVRSTRAESRGGGGSQRKTGMLLPETGEQMLRKQTKITRDPTYFGTRPVNYCLTYVMDIGHEREVTGV